VCHQSVGLIARDLEKAGIPTTSLTSAWSITAAARPPRAAFLDYPLGHTSGKPLDRADQLACVRGALDLLDGATEPGTTIDLHHIWSNDDSWKRHPLTSGKGAGDGRTARSDEPVYQEEEDRVMAAQSAGACRSCVGVAGH
jgi:hypothetical protein